MTAGNDGASTPEDDDPFGYLYADGQASGATPPSSGGGYGYPGPRSGQPGPRTSYHQVRAVGQRQYGQQTQYGQQAQGAQGGYGYPPAQSGADGRTASLGQVPAQGPDQPNAHYQAPETLAGGPGAGRPAPPRGYGDGGGQAGRGRGPNTRGLLIGAIAVVAAVVIGIGIAILSGDDDKDDPQAGSKPTAADSVEPSETAGSGQRTEPQDLPKADAKALKLDGGTVTASDIQGAKAGGGVYVGGLNQVGASATWTVNGIDKAGKYTLHIAYGVPGKDANVTLTVNGTPQTSPLDLKNWSGAEEGDWEKGWTESYTYVQLNKGTNTLRISCEEGNQCDANLDQVWLEKGWKKSDR